MAKFEIKMLPILDWVTATIEADTFEADDYNNATFYRIEIINRKFQFFKWVEKIHHIVGRFEDVRYIRELKDGE